MSHKGNEFKGLAGGAHYRCMAALFGMGTAFYRKGIGQVELAAGQKALDLGCGPGALSFALAERSQPGAMIVGIDLSNDQLDYARTHAAGFPCTLDFQRGSMDELPFSDETFDLVITSMALHETPPEVRRGAIAQTARVLKKGGRFVLVDWSKPRFGFWGLVWFPLVFWGERNRDNWSNVYPELCRSQGMVLEEDQYITSIVRRQAFRKEGAG